ncbi:HNH endonuclease signature motif containing protein [soil metagenome]
MSAHPIAARLAQQASELAVALAADVYAPADLPGLLERVGLVRRLADAVGADLAGEVDELSPGGDGSLALLLAEKSAVDVVATRAGIDPTDARDWCRVGRAIRPRLSLQGEVLPPDSPQIARAVASGDLGVSRASRVLAALGEVSPFVSPEKLAGLERVLVAHAATLTSRDLNRLCRSLPDIFDPDGSEHREDLLRPKAGVRIRQLTEGLTQAIVTMHPEAAGFLLSALDARTAPRRTPAFETEIDAVDPLRDDRPLAQRRLDALVAIARESLSGDTGQVAGTSVTMVVTVALDALQSGLGGACIEGVDQPISAATARRLAAHADLIPAVLGSTSEPLDVGFTQRLATSAQRRALGIRDQGCLWPGCQAPPGWCEVAHIAPWKLGGRTDLDNLALLCAFHHRRFDHDGWRLERQGSERFLIPPSHVDSRRTPRRVGPVQLAA